VLDTFFFNVPLLRKQPSAIEKQKEQLYPYPPVTSASPYPETASTTTGVTPGIRVNLLDRIWEYPLKEIISHER